MTKKSSTPSPSSPARTMLRSLRAADDTARALEATAPKSVAAAGGVGLILREFPSRETPMGYLAIDLSSPAGQALWEAMAREQQQGYRDGSAYE